ncbi:hypothetical protein FLA105534_00597 [Flavobacterium bizetiae]|uniref:Uncharacterized protein n=1 Tax=Flavobacterium bizetiae TaxID=2704140 RepID=A0A6J4GCG0_9FLAO|nr:hypothetical protein FLA105534_00597 [Flavobacterium bizetiae]CAD5341593.1 hypothetical protein FLA105535_01567 [Flavobacterium bizetiae]CAD5348179.1 hypothetical protein FLA105534_02139 [Flavobacterium bizetiae]
MVQVLDPGTLMLLLIILEQEAQEIQLMIKKVYGMQLTQPR